MYTHTRKTIVAGSIVVQALYPRRCRGDSDKVRAAKNKDHERHDHQCSH